MPGRRFELNVQCKEYTIDKHKHLDIGSQIEEYVRMYGPDITPDELKDLRCHKKYIRFMCFQDSENSEAYMYAYCRPIDSMIAAHRKEADPWIVDGSVLGEINFGKRGYFFNRLL